MLHARKAFTAHRLRNIITDDEKNLTLRHDEMRQTQLNLTEEDRRLVEAYRTKGLHHAREINRAHILAALDSGVPEQQIMAVLGVGRSAIWRTRRAFLQGGVEYAVHDAPRPGKPQQYGEAIAREIAVLLASRPPEGARRWTLDLLAQAARHRTGADHISRETVRRLLKSTPRPVRG